VKPDKARVVTFCFDVKERFFVGDRLVENVFCEDADADAVLLRLLNGLKEPDGRLGRCPNNRSTESRVGNEE
jgi:hypothetical protein